MHVVRGGDELVVDQPAKRDETLELRRLLLAAKDAGGGVEEDAVGLGELGGGLRSESVV